MMRRDVAVVALYREGKILLQERRSISKVGEEWGFFGGGIEAGETPEQALVREIDEELAFRLEQFTLLGEIKVEHPKRVGINYLFIAPCPPLERLTLREGDSCKLFTLNEMRELKLPSFDYPALDLIARYLDALDE